MSHASRFDYDQIFRRIREASPGPATATHKSYPSKLTNAQRGSIDSGS